MSQAAPNMRCLMQQQGPVTACLLLVLLLGVQNTPALAQDNSATPTYGTISLGSGFSPDPHVVDIVVGGELNAADTDSSCVGYVASAPDYSVTYEQEQYALSIIAISTTDTTLLVNDPDGTWFCNDDSSDLDNANPGIYFGSPKSGRYDIWIGSYSTDNNYVSAKLVISEQGTETWRTIATSLADTTTPVEIPDDPPEIPQEPVVVVPTEGVIQYGRKTN